MYNLPFVPSERPLIRHISLVRACLRLMERMDLDQEDDTYLEVSFFLQMLSSMDTCKEFWEHLRQDALDQGVEPDDPAMSIETIDPYQYEYKMN